MELQLATIDDIVHELRRREQMFMFVGVGHTNCQDKEVTYAYQGGSAAELVIMLRGLRKMLMDGDSLNQSNGVE